MIFRIHPQPIAPNLQSTFSSLLLISGKMTFHAVLMSDPRFDEIDGRVRKSYPNACILYIDEVRNADLLEKYQERKSSIEKTRGSVKEDQLFHGTSVDAIHAIVEEGFKTACNKVSAFGKGTYFARNANYSYAYMKESGNGITYMFLSDVLIGACGRYGSGQTIITKTHDNSVDHDDNPSIVVTPYDDGAYPRFLIAFHKNAK